VGTNILVRVLASQLFSLPNGWQTLHSSKCLIVLTQNLVTATKTFGKYTDLLNIWLLWPKLHKQIYFGYYNRNCATTHVQPKLLWCLKPTCFPRTDLNRQRSMLSETSYQCAGSVLRRRRSVNSSAARDRISAVFTGRVHDSTSTAKDDDHICYERLGVSSPPCPCSKIRCPRPSADPH